MAGPKITQPQWGGGAAGNLVEITDGVNEADIIAVINSLKVDLSSVAGTATAVNSGNLSNGVQRVAIATDDVNMSALVTDLAAIEVINAAIQTAVEAIDNIVGTIDSAHGTGVAVIGGKAESTVPTEVADGDAVAVWFDTFGRLVQLATDIAQSAMSVSDIAPAQMQVARWLDWAALTAPDDETPEANVQDYENLTVEYIIASIDTSVDLIIWASIDGGTTWFELWSDTIDSTEDQTDAVTFTGIAIERIKCEFDAEVGGTNATVTFKAMAGN